MSSETGPSVVAMPPIGVTVKVTLPVGVPAPGAATVICAESVNVPNATAGVGMAVNAVIVPALFTVCSTMPLPLTKLPSPFVYIAVIVSAPTTSALVVTVAVAWFGIPITGVSAPPVSIVLSLEMNVTVPVGVAPDPVLVTVAVKVTLCPNTLVGFIAPLLLTTVTLVGALFTV